MSLFDSLLNNTFTVYRRQRSPDGQGGWPEGWAPVGQVVGRLRPLTGAERIVAAQVERQITHVLYVVAGADVQRGDQVEGAGQIVEVLGVREPSHAEHHLEIDCLEKQTEPAEAAS